MSRRIVWYAFSTNVVIGPFEINRKFAQKLHKC